MKPLFASTIVGCALLLAACDKPTAPKSTDTSQASTSDKTVIATTTMIADMAASLSPEGVQVKSIMQPGGDPHLHQPTPGDAKMVARSDMVLTNGLHLEGWIDDLVRNAGGTRDVVVVSQGVKPIAMEGSPGGVDPHFWFDLSAWKQASLTTSDALIKLVGAQTPQAAQIKRKTAAYTARLDALKAWSAKNLESIPRQQRVLVTSHDAFNYFGRGFGIQVKGIQGSSTEQEASPRDVANIIELVRANKVPAIFIESSVNPSLIKQVSRETGVKAMGPLFSDSLGPKGSGADTYEGMIQENVRLITQGLGGTYSPFVPPTDPKTP